MGVVTCRIYTLDTTHAHDPISGVLVRVFDESGTTFITSGTTNASGWVNFDLTGSPSPSPTRYQFRCSKIGVSFQNPEYGDVYDPLPPATTNNFNIYGNIHEVQNALNPRMCRASGFFLDPGGRPVPDLIIRFMNLFDPMVVDGAVITTKLEVRTDQDGWASVELPQGGKYVATVSGLHDETIKVVVPERGGVSLTDLLFPVVARIDWSPAGPWSVSKGSQITLTPTITTTAYTVLTGTANGDLTYQVEDSSVAGLSVGEESITITGLAVGSTVLRVSQKDNLVKRIPPVTIVGDGISISVV